MPIQCYKNILCCKPSTQDPLKGFIFLTNLFLYLGAVHVFCIKWLSKVCLKKEFWFCLAVVINDCTTIISSNLTPFFIPEPSLRQKVMNFWQIAMANVNLALPRWNILSFYVSLQTAITVFLIIQLLISLFGSRESVTRGECRMFGSDQKRFRRKGARFFYSTRSGETVESENETGCAFRCLEWLMIEEETIAMAAKRLRIINYFYLIYDSLRLHPRFKFQQSGFA